MPLPSAPTPAQARAAADLFREGRDAEVVPLARELTRAHPQHGLGWMLLGAALKRQGRFAEALPAQQRAVELLPNRPELHSNLGATLFRLGREDEAERCYRAALLLDRQHPDALFNLGRLQTKQDRYAEATATFGLLVQLLPADGEAHKELGIALGGLERWIEAERCHRRALDLGHRDAVLHDNLSRALLEQGRPEEALQAIRDGLALQPDDAHLLGNTLFTWSYVPGPRATGLPPEAQRFDAVMAAAAGPPRTAWACEPRPDALRVGFVSGDLRRHPVASFLAGFLPHGPAHGVRWYAYSTGLRDDPVTAQLRTHFSGWQSIAGLGADEAAARIGADGIHILIDLAGQTAHNRLDVFARTPAPLQLTWLGYPASTGLSRIGYTFTDPHTTAPDDAACYTERFWPLPEAWFCYTPLEPPPEVTPPPALAGGHVTFGSFNNMPKLNDAVIRTWARILGAVPGSQLLLRNWQLHDAAMVARTQERFAAQGVGAQRLLLEGPIPSLAGHLAQYARVDIALDPFPFVGGTTSTEALFMGVPVLTLRGQGHMMRLGESLLQHAGLPGWIAASEDDYVARAAAFAADPVQLAALRAQLRPRLARTALFDGALYAQQFCAALWRLWHERAPGPA